MKTLALYTGSFNPVHAGHIQVIETAKQIFGKYHVGILLADNPQKTYDVSKDKRSHWLWQATGIRPYYVEGYVCDFCDDKIRESADEVPVWDNIVLIWGVRSGADLDAEIPMAGYNYNLSHGKYPTVLIPTPASLRDLSSSAVRQLAQKDWGTFHELLYKPYVPEGKTCEEWEELSYEIWKTFHKENA